MYQERKVCARVRESACVGWGEKAYVCERVCVCEREKSVCVCVRERERECVGEREKKVCVCVCV